MKDPVWHDEIINPAVAHTLKALHARSLLDGFYLAGGTGLALQLGHRRSLDLDFFCREPFNEEQWLQRLQTLPGFSVVSRDRQTLHVHTSGVKVSFLGYAYPVLFPSASFLDVAVADPRDIACMKISAITSRGSKRDFVDVFAVAQQEGLKLMLALFERKFAAANYSAIHVLKSLTYFDDADGEPMPDMIVPMSWEDIKRFFRQQVPRLL